MNLSFTAIHPAMHHTNIPGRLGGNWNDPGETWTSNNFKKTTSKVSGFLHHPIISNHLQSYPIHEPKVSPQDAWSTGRFQRMSKQAWRPGKHMFRSHSPKKSDVRPKKVSPTMFVMFVGLPTVSNSHKYKLHQVASSCIISYHIISSMNPNVILSNVNVHQSSYLYRGPHLLQINGGFRSRYVQSLGQLSNLNPTPTMHAL